MENRKYIIYFASRFGLETGCKYNTKKTKNNRQMKKVLVPHGDRKFLADMFDVTTVCVRNALKFSSNSELAKRIRMAAIERGGAEVDVKPKQTRP